jgi:hypothetical protein
MLDEYKTKCKKLPAEIVLAYRNRLPQKKSWLKFEPSS